MFLNGSIGLPFFIVADLFSLQILVELAKKSPYFFMSNNLTDYINRFYIDNKVPTALERRLLLIKEMDQLEATNVHCFSCPGTCCTQSANSMQVSPIEALEVLASLKLEEKSPEEKESIFENLRQTIKEFRLDVELFIGKRSSEFRRTYTCPFFKRESKGCGLSRAAKPYGCLGFNPKAPNDNGNTCTSNIPLLEKRETALEDIEKEANTIIKKKFQLYWDKKNLPQALIELDQKLNQNPDLLK